MAPRLRWLGNFERTLWRLKSLPFIHRLLGLAMKFFRDFSRFSRPIGRLTCRSYTPAINSNSAIVIPAIPAGPVSVV